MGLAVSPDESKWFLYSASIVDDCISIFDVYDTESDTVIFSTRIRPGLGDLAMARDGKYVYFTNPCYGAVPNPGCPDGSLVITIFDPGSNQLLKTISTIATYGEAGFSYVHIGALATTPDGKWILGTSVFSGYVLINAEAATVEKFEAIGTDLNGRYLYSPTVQTGI
jgi:DNA-binding beta-propeller fold protein YncE